MASDTDMIAVVATIAGGEEAWAKLDDVEARYPGAAEALEALGLVVFWERTDYRAVCLTPWGAFKGIDGRRLVIAERYEFSTLPAEGDWPAVRVAEEVPVWEDECRAKAREAERRPVRTVRDPREEPLWFPERVIDHRTPEPVIDEVTGEPLKLFGQTVYREKRRKTKAGGKRRA